MNAFYIALNVFIFICYAILVLCIIGCIAGVLFGIIKKEYKKALYVFSMLVLGLLVIVLTRKVDIFINCVLNIKHIAKLNATAKKQKIIILKM